MHFDAADVHTPTHRRSRRITPGDRLRSNDRAGLLSNVAVVGYW
jgi:hypothetical protein